MPQKQTFRNRGYKPNGLGGRLIDVVKIADRYVCKS